jgi:4-diphosphocytidyl-2C-methyl-D-erythritol kinase
MSFKMILGKHVSIAGGLDKSFKRAANIGCNSMQIFVKSPRRWKMREVEAEEMKAFKMKLIESVGSTGLVMTGSGSTFIKVLDDVNEEVKRFVKENKGKFFINIYKII